MMRTIVCFLVLVVAGLLLPAAPVSACIWNPAHNFSPFPPCETEDFPGHNRVAQVNGRIGGKLLVTAAKIREVKTEIRQWQALHTEALAFERALKRVYGNVTANPIPSLVAEYNRINPMSTFVRIRDEDGGWQLELADLSVLADSILTQFEGDMLGLYNEVATAPDRMTRMIQSRGARIESEFYAVRDFQRASAPVRDSLMAMGERLAGRYEGEASDEGESEATITTLSAALARLRGTAYHAQVTGLEARMQSVEAGWEGSRQIARQEALLRSRRGW